ncbi:MAG TPA: N-methyl-L-tryptophan oxidase [Actinobacteria bacterium]|nr:N-methyl-L-tryptophan oxidase [Actinomycetota bacterium]
MERVDVVVIGAGVMGSAATLALAERGVQTLLLEQFELTHARGSSHGTGRIFRISYPEAPYVRLTRRALGAWRSLEEAAGEPLVVTTGGLDAGPVAEDCARALEACGEAFEWLSPGDAEERYPAMSFDGFERVLYQADAGVCLADRILAAMIRLARAAGAEVRDRTPVLAVRPDDGDEGVTVVTAEGDIRARVAIVTAGAWAGEMLSNVGMPIALEPVLQHVSYYRGADRDAPPPAVPTFIEWGLGAELSWYSLGAEGSAQGVKVGAHVGGRPVDPRDGPFEVDPARVLDHQEYVRRRFPGLDPNAVLAETCLYTMTRDQDFVLDRQGPVVLGSPCSGHGFKFGMLIGEVLVDLALGQAAGLPAERFALGRAALRR